VSTENIAKSVHQRLLNIRDTTGEQFNHLLMRYGLERLLYRIQASGHAETFVLKGAMLFALWHDVPGRPTRDIDLLGFGDLTHDRLRAIFADACAVEVEDDGLRFDPGSIQTDDIRDDQEYHGVRVRLLGFLGRARLAIQIDVGFGDSLTPEPQQNDTAPRFLLHDRDSVYGDWFRSRVKGMGIEEILTAYRSPWQNPYCERVIGSIRRECLDNMMIFSENGLRRIMAEYVRYYNGARAHMSLEGNSPIPREVEPPSQGRVEAIPYLGGLHHRYTRAA
jgi:hypothetical protein